MAHKGFSRAVYAIMTGENTETYGTVKEVPAGVKIDINTNSAEGKFYAYDKLEEQDSEFSSADITIEVGENTKQMEADLLGHKLDSNGTIVYKSDDAAPYVAFGYEIKLSGSKMTRVWLHKVKFKQPTESAQTKTDNFNYGTTSLAGIAQARKTDEQWKAKVWSGDASFNTFFNEPYLGNMLTNVNKGVLEATIVYSNGIDVSGYSEDAVTTFRQAKAAAEAALEDSSKTQKQVDTIVNTLMEAVQGLTAA